MSHVRGTGHRGLTAAALAALLLGGVASAHAALTTESCLAKKLKEWGKLRTCQATENGKALQSKAFDLAKCQTKFAENLAKLSAKAADAGVACRYGVNGDGTATDYDMGLQWEQKTDDGSVHDKDNTYTWSILSTTPNGTAFTGFLASLNNCASIDGTTLTGGFAGHCDWRLPSVVELAGILDLSVPGCGQGFAPPCIDQTVFGPTVVNPSILISWSATTDATNPADAFDVYFGFGAASDDAKTNVGYVRGVRSGL